MVDRARRTIETEGFASLYLRCPEVRLPGTDRVAAAMRAFVAGDETLIETLIQQARPYIYTTALPPAIASLRAVTTSM